ncbi:O-antigen ligase [uncultured Microbacterium sp.]|uniref:O-antigen ligase family protein n=1 Tax=uncultured Microbacterium sp. TaxID=191216 RepID=UPI0025F2FE23|nr:O-antigen ligase family protein [uncultured Microbacterium sp.]
MTGEPARVPRLTAPPVEARLHRSFRGARRGGAVTLLTIYVVLLFAFPSNMTIGSLGSLGRPAMLWGIVLLVVWMLTRLQTRAHDVVPVRQPVRWLLGLLLVIALVSFAAALLRGQPADQISPAFTAMLRLLSWAGVVLIAVDGLRTYNDVATLIRVLVIGATCLAVLGLAQFLTKSTLLDWFSALPGIAIDVGGVDDRGGFTRAAATATNPLEFTAAMAAILPLAIAAAALGGFRAKTSARGWWWVPPALIVVVSVLAVSRSATIGLAIAIVASVPALPRAYRWRVSLAALAAIAVVVVVVPGLLSTILGLFTGAGSDPSTQSRTNAFAQVPEFLATSPLVGDGFGTFLARYYIFDNQWVLMLIELGILGVLALAGLVGVAIWSAASVARRTPFDDTRTLGRAVAASMATVALLFLFFDGLSFAISAGVFFLVVGLCAAVRTIGSADGEHVDAHRRLGDHLRVEHRDPEDAPRPMPVVVDPRPGGPAPDGTGGPDQPMPQVPPSYR